MQVAAERVRES